MSYLLTGLKQKAWLGLIIIALIVLVPAMLVGWQTIKGVQDYFGRAYAENLTQLNRERILAPVSRDLVLAQRLADSTLVEDWLRNEKDPDSRSRFFKEAIRYRDDFRGSAFFLVSAQSGHYYFSEETAGGNDKLPSESPRYTLSPDNPDDAWFYNLKEEIGEYNINVNPDVELGTTRVWLNLPIRDEGQFLGLAGTGLDLTNFINDFIRSDEPGVIPMLIGPKGAIQAHPDPSRIAYGSSVGVDDQGNNIFSLLSTDAERQALRNAMAELNENSQRVMSFYATMDNKQQLISLAHLPELNWFLVNAVDLGTAKILLGNRAGWLLVGFIGVFGILLIAIGIMVSRVIIKPLKSLQVSATQIADGHYEVSLPAASRDEIGDLVRAFESMTEQVRNHTRDLESRVRERTRELESRNQEIAQFNRMVNDSIDYASLIQKAILPDASLQRWFRQQYLCLWRPRDTVGGDYYLFHSNDQGSCVMGVVDCAGHGVPGALMTMLSRAAFDQAIRDVGLTSPAAILQRTDTVLRAMLQDLDLPKALATNMDAGLLHWHEDSGVLRYAGAKMALYCVNGRDVDLLPGDKQALVGRKKGDYQDRERILTQPLTVYLTSDGFLDQAGGDLGYGLGQTGFIELLRQAATLPLVDQSDWLWEKLVEYQGKYEQRDDICVMGLHLNPAQER